ncbi:MAG: trypsin-like peptidase domain-containing protein, partial [Bacteroidales bacterium]|nr:trypsin-like peptidase domain-containing protein [Bacteroidales bacterium]
PWGGLSTLPVEGDQLIVEMDVPDQVSFKPELQISRISHDFTGIFKQGSEFGHSGACNVDINCPPGNDWQIEKRSVVKFIRSGYWLCSGALINNSRNDGRPLLLTAHHCIGTETHAHQSVFFFRYESAYCGGPDGPSNYTISGSELLATTGKVDFCLVELSLSPPESYCPYYSGWDNRMVSYYDTVTTIHHPSGDVKKISQSYRRIATGDFGAGFDPNTHWKIDEWDLGTTEPGSSGAPLFNTDHKIIGDLTGGDASCDYNYNDYFQKLSVSWDRYSDSTEQLKYWLDPMNLGVGTINGYDPYREGQPEANIVNQPIQGYVGKKVYFRDLSTGMPDSWNWEFQGGTPAFSTNQHPGGVIFNSSGLKTIKLRVTNQYGSDSVRQTIHILESTGYSVSDTRVPENRPIQFSEQNSGSPLYTKLEIINQDHQSVIVSGNQWTPLTAGNYDVRYRVAYTDYEKTFYHYNQLNVVSDPVILHSSIVTHIDSTEHVKYYRFGPDNYLPGTNTSGMEAFAEVFRNPLQEDLMISGMEIGLAITPETSYDLYLPVVIWDAKWEVKTRDSILLTGREPNSRITVRFRSPVAFDSLIYAGFETPSIDPAGFSSSIAVDRGAEGANTLFIRKSSKWSELSSLTGMHAALDVSLEVSVIRNQFSDEIKVLPVPASQEFVIDLGDLVYKECSITVYDLSGRQVTSTLITSDNRIRFRVEPPVSGIYLAYIRIDAYHFTKKILIVRNQ